jgi:hypothetical protein
MNENSEFVLIPRASKYIAHDISAVLSRLTRVNRDSHVQEAQYDLPG